MITYLILRHAKPPPQTKETGFNERFNGKLGTQEHRRFVLRRGLANCPFTRGEEIIYKKKRYQVTDFLDEDYFEYMGWRGMAPLFLELADVHDGEIIYVNPGDCKKPRKNICS